MAYQRTRPQRRTWQAPLVIGVVVGALLAGFLLGNLMRDGGGETGQTGGSVGPSGPGTGASASPGASAPGATAASSAAPAEAVVEAPADILPPGSAVRVTVDGLRLREEPTTAGAELATFAVGDHLLVGFSHHVVTWGPFEADGFAWYPVAALTAPSGGLPPLPGPTVATAPETGWVAGGDSTEAFLELVAPRCIDAPVDLGLLEAMLPWERLACYGNRQLTIEGTYGCSGCDGAFEGTFTPEWLAHPLGVFNVVSTQPQPGGGPMSVAFPPAVATPNPGEIVRMTGHHDDPAAAECVAAPGEGGQNPIDERTASLYCRERFVVESIEVLGTDPDFPN